MDNNGATGEYGLMRHQSGHSLCEQFRRHAYENDHTHTVRNSARAPRACSEGAILEGGVVGRRTPHGSITGFAITLRRHILRRRDLGTRHVASQLFTLWHGLFTLGSAHDTI